MKAHFLVRMAPVVACMPSLEYVSLCPVMVTVQDITIHFGGNTLFSRISFQIQPEDRIGLVGMNGSGKSTLLRMLTSEISPDEGSVSISGDVTLGYLPQHITVQDSRSVYAEAASSLEELNRVEEQMQQLSAEIAERDDFHSETYLKLTEKLATASERFYILGGETREKEITQTLLGLGFTEKDLSRQTKEFSGGWRMRIELAKILLKRPSVLLLDEPTNHLDIGAIQWLEDYFSSFRGALVLVSHDRALLDHVTTRTLETGNGTVTDYPVSFSKAMKLKEERLEQQIAAWRNQQKMISATEAFIERFRYKATKAVQVQSRIKQLEKLERIPEPILVSEKVHLTFGDTVRSGDIVLSAEKVSKSYGNLHVLKNVDLLITRGEKIALVGRNGEGKTTLIQVITGNLECEGRVRLGTKVSVGYYAQDEAEKLNPGETVFETVEHQAGPDVRPQLRTMLGTFLFSGDTIDKKVRVLSGGERSRLALLALLLRPVNFLIMDEPTHHLDMQTKDILKQALLQFDGTLLLVSHDRDFLDGLVDKIYEVRDHGLKVHDGNIYRFLKETALQDAEKQHAKRPEKKKATEGKNIGEDRKKDYLLRKQLMRDLDKAGKKINHLEVEIAVLEERKAILEKKLEVLAESGKNDDPEIYGQYEHVTAEIEQKMHEWEIIVRAFETLKHKVNI